MSYKRKNKRTHITATALIRSLDGDSEGKPFNGLVMNISRGGAEFSATQYLKPGESFEAVLWFIDSNGKVAGGETVQGVARWKKKLPPFYMFGVEFSDINPKTHKELLQYIESVKDE